MSAPSVMDFLRRMASMADAHRREFQLDRFASQDLEDASDDQKALAAVAELVAADREYDEARAAVNCLRDGVSTIGEVVAAEGRLKRSQERRAAALAPFGAPDERR